jgi:hypothetical protein
MDYDTLLIEAFGLVRGHRWKRIKTSDPKFKEHEDDFITILDRIYKTL